MINLAQDFLIVTRILANGCGIPLATAIDARQSSLQLVFAVHLMLVGVVRVGELNGSVHILTNKDRTLTGICAPPTDKRLIISGFVANLPINLRNVVVHPTLTHPFQHIGIEVVIVLEACCGTSFRVGSLIAIDAERRDTELHPRLCPANLYTHLFHELVDVFSAPIVAVHSVPIHIIGSVVGNGNASHRIGIEIVVHMYAIHIISAHNIASHLADIVAILGDSRVEEEQAIVVEETFRMASILMIRSQCRRSLCLGAIRINPCMQLHTSCMTLFNHPLQRVPIRVRRKALLTGQITTPRLQLTGIERIAFHSNLEENGIDAVLLKVVELARKHSLHTVATNVLKLSVDCLNPSSTEFSLGILSHCGCRYQEQQNK